MHRRFASSSSSPGSGLQRLHIWIISETDAAGLPDLDSVETFDVRHFPSVEDARRAAAPGVSPDVVILVAIDNAGSTVRGLRLAFPAAAVVVWSQERDKNQVAQALAAGAQIVSTDSRTAILAPRLRDAVSRQRRNQRRRQDFEQRRRMLEQENRRLKSLVHAVAGTLDHDLVALLGHLDQAFDHVPEGSPLVDLLDLVDHHGSRASELAQELATYTGSQRLAPEPLDLAETVEEVQIMARAGLLPGQELVLNPGLNLPLVEADPSTVCRLTVDLILTVARGTPADPGATVTLSTGARQCDREHLVDILGGDGMRSGTFVYLEAAVDLAGEPAELDPREIEGIAGLEAVLRDHYGGLRSTLRQGRWTLQALLPAFERSSEDEVPLAKGWHAGGKILLIEPNPLATASVLPTLERLGFDTTAVDDGAAALDGLRRAPESYVLAILDADESLAAMPDLLSRLVAVRGDLPILISSGRSEADVDADGDFTDAAGFIRKPFRIVNLRRIFRRVLDLETGYLPTVGSPEATP